MRGRNLDFTGFILGDRSVVSSQITHLFAGNVDPCHGKSPFLVIGELKYGKRLSTGIYVLRRSTGVRCGFFRLDCHREKQCLVGPFRSLLPTSAAWWCGGERSSRQNDPWLRRVRDAWDSGLIRTRPEVARSSVLKTMNVF